MANESSQTLLLYYATSMPLCFTQQDLGGLMMMIGLSSVLTQGLVLRPLVRCFGERRVLILSSLAGAVHTVFYAFATAKSTLTIGAAFTCLTQLSLPTVSAIKSNNASESEQGLIQGALYAAKSLAAAIGPFAFRQAAAWTKDCQVEGAYWLLGTVLFSVSIVFAIMLPERKSNSKYFRQETEGGLGATGGADEDNDDINRSKMVRFAEDEDVRPSSVV